VVDAVLAIAVVAAASCLQAAIGFGVNLVATPLLLLLGDGYVPGPVLLASTVLNLLVSRREGRGAIDPAIDVAIAAQVIGAVGAGAVLASLPITSLSVAFAACVLAAVGLSASGVHLVRSRRSLAGAGLLSGFMGTVSGIGAPPIALLYQRSEAAGLRATLARYFLVGGVVALLVLTATGLFGIHELVTGCLLLPSTLVGFLASRWVVPRLGSRSLRPYVLLLSAGAAILVLGRDLL
jgi:uncharacterized membrane protein YfcA